MFVERVVLLREAPLGCEAREWDRPHQHAGQGIEQRATRPIRGDARRPNNEARMSAVGNGINDRFARADVRGPLQLCGLNQAPTGVRGNRGGNACLQQRERFVWSARTICGSRNRQETDPVGRGDGGMILRPGSGNIIASWLMTSMGAIRKVRREVKTGTKNAALSESGGPARDADRTLLL
jgi:hypothetical protein